MSESLIWHLIRDNNSFLVKRGNTRRDGSVQFSSEPGNLLNVNTFKYSGIANQRTIDLSTSDLSTVAGVKRPFIVLKKRSEKNLNKPSSAISSTDIKKGPNDFAKVVKDLSLSSYRGDLAAAAKVRYMKLYKDTKVQRGHAKSARSATPRGSR